jgi:hypothetical protein
MPKCLAAVNVLIQKYQQFQASVSTSSGTAQAKSLTYPTTSKITPVQNNVGLPFFTILAYFRAAHIHEHVLPLHEMVLGEVLLWLYELFSTPDRFNVVAFKNMHYLSMICF